MKIVVTHNSPDMDAITSVWLIRRFLQRWENAVVQFVPAGERLDGSLDSSRPLNDSSDSSQARTSSLARENSSNEDTKEKLFKRSFRGGTRPANYLKSSSHAKAPRATDTIEIIGEDEVIHVDTGLGPLDHHQTASDKVCGASLTFDFVKRVRSSGFGVQGSENNKLKDRMEAVGRMVKVVVDIDHFKEVFWEDPLADYHDFSLVSILDGLKLKKPNQDNYYVDFISNCLDAVLHEFENRIWAEEEIAKDGLKFKTRFGLGIGFETINDSVIKLAQKMGYSIVVRKDPRKGYVRIKARPMRGSPRQFDDSSSPVLPQSQNLARVEISEIGSEDKLFKSSSHAKAPRAKHMMEIDLTLAYEKLRKMDPSATWFLHIGKKMLLNGSVKNPKMRPTKLGLGEIIRVLEKI